MSFGFFYQSYHLLHVSDATHKEKRTVVRKTGETQDINKIVRVETLRYVIHHVM